MKILCLCRREKVPMLWLVGLCVVLFALCRGLWTPADWTTPFQYDGDALQYQTWLKAASEGEYYPVLPLSISRLGAPGEANWNDYPMYEKTVTMILGWVTAIVGLGIGANLTGLLTHVTAALSFFLCCRWLKYRREWSFVGAVLFGFAYYQIWRGLAHVLLAYSYTIPVGLLCCWLVAGSRRVSRANGLGRFCVGVGVLMGISSPYNLNIYLQLLCWALIAQWFTQRRRENLVVGLQTLAFSIAAFFVVNFGTFYYRLAHGPNPEGIIRNYYEVIQYGLKFIECVIPPGDHNLSLFGRLGKYYATVEPIPGEMFSAYQGVVGLLAGACLLVVTVVAATAKSRGRVPAHALQAGWIYLYSAIGGMNAVVGLGGLMLFRAANRYSIFISALVLMFLVGWLTKWSAGWSARRRWVLAAVILVVGLIDQVPIGPGRVESQRADHEFRHDREFVQALEAELPAGAMVFQLPVVGFPEAKPIKGFDTYDPVRLYLHSHDLRFSYGANKGRPEEYWMTFVEKASPEVMVETLERFGFQALVLHRDALPDQGSTLAGFIEELGRPRFLDDREGGRVCFLLHPAANPEFPDPADYPRVDYLGPWSRWDLIRTKSCYWSSQTPEVVVHHAGSSPQPYQISLQLATVTDRPVRITLNDQPLWEGNLKASSETPVSLVSLMAPGENWIRLETDTVKFPPLNVGGNDLAIGMVNLRVQPAR